MTIPASDQAYAELASQFPDRYQVGGTEYLRGLLKALGEGDGFVKTLVEETRKDLIAVTATGKFLDRRAGLYGITRGKGVGILDTDFQRIVPTMGMSPKQISHILLQIIDIMYGPFSTHANATSGNFAPFALSDGDRLVVRVDDTEITIRFGAEDAIAIGAATAEEVATAISQKSDGRLIGIPIIDSKTGNKFVNIRTHTLGSQGFIQIRGGDAQIALRFPDIRPVVFTALNTWNVTRFDGSSEMVYTVTAGAPPNIQLAGVKTGDLVTIRANAGFRKENVGTFPVSFVGTNFFRIENPSGIPQLGVTQAHLDDFLFFAPVLDNVFLAPRTAAVAETSAHQLSVLLPVTSPVVKRTLRGGHHFHQGITPCVATTINSMVLSSTAGFPVTGAVRPALSRLPSRGVVSSIGTNKIVLIDGQNWPNKGAFWAPNLRMFFYFSSRSGNELDGVQPNPAALTELPGATVDYVEQYSYTGTTGSTLTGVYPDPTGLTGKEVVAAGATVSANYPGSFLNDPVADFIAAKDFTTISEPIEQGSVRTLLQVGDVTSWPSTGSFVIEFNTRASEGPIKYLAKVGNEGLIVDPGHLFTKDHLKGVGIRLVRQIGSVVPRLNGQDLSVYMTSTSLARDLLATYLRSIIASGVLTRFVINTPPEKWPVLPNLFTTDPLATELVVI